MKKVWLCLGLLVLGTVGMAMAAEPQGPAAGVWAFEKGADGRIYFVQVATVRGDEQPSEPIEPWDGDFVPGTACNGGSCVPAGGGSVSCPSTGTLRCKVGQDCLCKCHKDANGSWYGKNECV
jgi:hypothetical protein